MPQIKDIAITKTSANNDDWLHGQEVGGATFKIKKSDLITQQSAGVNLDYRFILDKNGLIYNLGTNGYTQAFTNPSGSSLVLSASSLLSVDSVPANATNRIIQGTASSSAQVFHTQSGAGQWMKLNLIAKTIKPRYYLIQGRRDFNGQHLRNWQLQGSNDDSNWDVLDTQSSNTAIGQGTWFIGDCREVTQYYRYLRIFQTGNNSSSASFLTFSQIEFYGDLQ
jgi:hypothetical protein